MNFVHVADIHFDTPFRTLVNRADLGQLRRIEQRKAFSKMIEFIKEKKVEYLFISGDLYEEEYIRKSTIDYINDLFKEINNTKIYITPGNHDPYLKNSYYSNYKWAENVKIFTEKIEVIKEDDVNIYGYGFNNFEMNENQLEKIIVEDEEKINILITHGDLYSESNYNKINKNKLINKNFGYVALGHIHKRDEYYSGSLISLGFDEPGEHGFYYGEFNKLNGKYFLNKTFIKIDEREFIKKEIDVTNILSQEELIEKINSIKTGNNYFEINLVGTRVFINNINMKLIQTNIIKIKDNTKFKNKISENNNTLSGIFIKKLDERLKNGTIDEETYQKIIELESRIMTQK